MVIALMRATPIKRRLTPAPPQLYAGGSVYRHDDGDAKLVISPAITGHYPP